MLCMGVYRLSSTHDTLCHTDTGTAGLTACLNERMIARLGKVENVKSLMSQRVIIRGHPSQSKACWRATASS